MTRILLATFLLASFVGCEKSTEAEKKVDLPEKAMSGEKSVDDAKKHIQEQIDRYLGGQRTTEQGSKIVMGKFWIKHAGERINSISILNALQAYSDKGERQTNMFKLSIQFTGDKWSETEEATVIFNEEKGTWASL